MANSQLFPPPSDGFRPSDPLQKNYWIARDEYPFVIWYAHFPEGVGSRRKYLDFLKEVLEIAEKEQVY